MAAIEAMHLAVDDLSTHERFHGYGPEQGYFWLREAIAKKAYQVHGVHVEVDEIYVSDGAKCDTGNILDIFGTGNKIAVPDPVYPVYVDTNVMAGEYREFQPGWFFMKGWCICRALRKIILCRNCLMSMWI